MDIGPEGPAEWLIYFIITILVALAVTILVVSINEALI